MLPWWSTPAGRTRSSFPTMPSSSEDLSVGSAANETANAYDSAGKGTSRVRRPVSVDMFRDPKRMPTDMLTNTQTNTRIMIVSMFFCNVKDVLLGSAGAAELLLCNLVEGTYVFHLRATDHRGRSGTASATVEVRAEPGADQQVELELMVPVSQVSVSQRDTLVRQLAALLHVDNAHIMLRGLRPRSPVSCVLRVCVLAPDGGGLLPARAVLRVLRKQLMGDNEGFLLFPVLNVDSVVCVLECSGRGQCDPIGRKCLCRHLWTENLIRRYLGDGETNCEWDLLSVALSGLVIVLIILVIVRTLACCCKRRRVKVRKRSRYAILPNAAEDEDERMELRPKFGATNGRSSLATSESEWDCTGQNAHP